MAYGGRVPGIVVEVFPGRGGAFLKRGAQVQVKELLARGQLGNAVILLRAAAVLVRWQAGDEDFEAEEKRGQEKRGQPLKVKYRLT